MQKILCLVLILLLSFTGMAQQSGITCNGKKIAIREKNLEMIINRHKGGRIVSLKIDGTELLSQKHGLNKNYGSTLWFSPQITWGWPPSRTLDRKPYTIEVLPNGVLMRSRICRKYKLQFEKKIEVDTVKDTFIITYSIINKAGYNQCLAPWEVTRLKKGCRVFFPMGRKAPLNHFLYGGNTWHYTEKETKAMEGLKINDGIFDLFVEDKKHHESMKYFADGNDGWVAYQKGDVVLIKTFENIDYSSLPPNQSELEVFVCPKRYIEVEEHGVYTLLKPGEKLIWQVKWYVRKIGKDAGVGDVKGIVK